MKNLLLFLFILTSCGQTTDISLIYINDTHSKHDSSIKKDTTTGKISTNGGSALLATAIKDLKSQRKNALAVHAGDAVTGSVYSIIYQGIDSTDILNLSDFDLAVLGNHEFDFGLEKAYEIINTRNFPTIAANAYEQATGKAMVPPIYTTNINNKSIGFIGLLTSDEVYAHKDKPNQFIVSNYITSLSNLIQSTPSLLTNDLLILLSHIGYEEDQTIAKIFPNLFHVIVGGHSHTPLAKPTKINNTLIVQLDSNTKEVGVLDLKISKDNKIASFKNQIIPLKNITPDPNIIQYLTEKQGRVEKEMGEKLAYLETHLGDDKIRLESTPLGNFITDMGFDTLADKGIDFLLLNSGGLRSSLNVGNITLGHMYELHPFDNTAVYFETTGKTIKDILQHSVNNVHGTGGFLQLSKNITVTVSKDKQIASVKIKDQEIINNKIYKLILSDWTFNGGDSYTMILPNAKNIQYLGFDIRDLLINKFKQIKTIKSSDIDFTPRIIFE